MKITLPIQKLASALGATLLLAGLPAMAEQTIFPTPEAAAQALIDAASEDGPEGLLAVLGPELEELASPDPVSDAQERADFVEAALEAAGIEQEDDEHAVLVIGPDDWPFPIPLVRGPEGWYFDTPAGVEELMDRRVGRNELATIDVMRAYVDAQYEYEEADRNGDGMREYAQKFFSSEGARDGLYWPAAEDEPESPMGSLVAEAVAKGYGGEKSEGPRPYFGYLYQILTVQGEQAPGGSKSYLEDGHMTKGFGLMAWPAEYGNSGVMTFQVNQSGIVYQKDQGEDTGTIAAAIDAYNPDASWEPVTDEEPDEEEQPEVDDESVADDEPEADADS